MKYRSPALTGDVTYLNGEVIELNHDERSGEPIATVRVSMTNHKQEVMAGGNAEVRLPSG